MPLSADEYKSRIVVGLAGGELLAANIDLLWKRQDRFAFAPEVQYLRTTIDAILVLLGNLDEQLTEPVSEDRLGRLLNRRRALEDMLAQYQTELAAQGNVLPVGSSGNSIAAMGLLKTTAIINGDPQFPYADPNDTRFSGDPTRRPVWVVPP